MIMSVIPSKARIILVIHLIFIHTLVPKDQSFNLLGFITFIGQDCVLANVYELFKQH
jgi:hypothetical protein